MYLHKLFWKQLWKVDLIIPILQMKNHVRWNILLDITYPVKVESNTDSGLDLCFEKNGLKTYCMAEKWMIEGDQPITRKLTYYFSYRLSEVKDSI